MKHDRDKAVEKFKIDLIVWKFVQIHHIPVLIHRLK